jgi:hypothetical protein
MLFSGDKQTIEARLYRMSSETENEYHVSTVTNMVTLRICEVIRDNI